MQSIYSTETYAYGVSKDIICNKEKNKRNNIKMFTFDYITKEDIKNIIQNGQKFLTIHT